MESLSGIVFFQTGDLDLVSDFYQKQLNLDLWLDQEQCVILQHHNLLLGFCERTPPDNSGTITLFYRSKEDVDEMYHRLSRRAESEPRVNEEFDIYQFFARDPEDRPLEFQTFLHSVSPVVNSESSPDSDTVSSSEEHE